MRFLRECFVKDVEPATRYDKAMIVAWAAEKDSLMNRDIWSGLTVFAQIVEAGSFAGAAKRMGVSASALSHAMRALEARLDIRLLNRTTRSLAPTDAGQILLARLQPAMASVENVLGELDSVRSRPIGRVRVNAHKPAEASEVFARPSGRVD